jgi:ABC-type transport system involved in multi-copper enzyme maturation permease subunit
MPIVYRVAQLGRLGLAVVRSIVVYQFLVVQLVAIALVSSSLSDEIRSGTLSVLMTTPISSLQIVMGKLLSRLLQVVLLVAISFPLLAVLRVCGGVPWGYVVSGICVTLATGVFAGALSLSLSLSCRHSHTVVVLALVVYLLLFGMVPGLLSFCETVGIIGRSLRQTVIALTNPFWQIYVPTYRMSGLSKPPFGQHLWPLHCLVLLGTSCVLLIASSLRLRSAALSTAYGATKKSWLLRRQSRCDTAGDSASWKYALRHLTGSPVVWKEMRKGLFGPGRADKAVSALLTVILALMILLQLAGGMRNIAVSYMAQAFNLIVMLRLAVLTAVSIAGEKEART